MEIKDDKEEARPFTSAEIVYDMYTALGVILTDKNQEKEPNLFSQRVKTLKFKKDVELGDEQAIMMEGGINNDQDLDETHHQMDIKKTE